MAKIDSVVRMAGLLALVVVGGCGDGPTALSSTTMHSARARWEATGIQDYRYEFRQQCECGPALAEAAIVEVRGGTVTNVSNRDSGIPAASDERRLFPTIDDLFDRIDDAIRRNAASLVVSYDDDLGYPTLISIDYDVQVIDDEVAIDASALAPL